ncbi:TIGR01841 family phasin [Massilia sp. CFBP9026]|uniref:phasin family protein n=1 Tax=Massilia sp. CFBP9026 TaxID=3096536 RepID=UPI002A6B59D2|nr:TIGR01841 family phasin [Massilia sp. CFBP9026]MDY0960633.1 TIGR01841 family phasin [Massilia sp. CFBP9026]
MYPFPQSVNPALRSHIDAQSAFLNELSQTMLRSFQQVFQLNMQFGQTLLEEATGTAQRMLSADRPTDALSAAASRAQPATDKLRSYQQELSQLAATAQVDLTRASEQHVQETSRTARALASEVTRASAEEADKSLRQQEETVKNSRDAFLQEAQRGASIGADYLNQLQGEAAGAKPDGQAGPPHNPGNGQDGNGLAGNTVASPPR